MFSPRRNFIIFLLLACSSFGLSQIEVRIGSVTVPPASLGSPSCIQVPIFIFDPMDNRDLRDLTITVEFSGNTEIIDGGIATPVLVANAFVAAGSGTGSTGITSPGTDLGNSNPGFPTPSCGAIFNQATQGGASVNFASGTNAGNWFINNDAQSAGRKTGFIIDTVFNGTIVNTTGNTEMLVAILEVPIIANPGSKQLLVSATSNMLVPGANTYTWDDGVRVDPQGNRVQISEDLVLPAEPAEVNIFDAVNCTGATATDPITWADPQDGGLGGMVSFTFPGTTNADRVVLTGDGLNETILSGGATTNFAIDTTNDGSPDPAGDPSYSAVYEVEFPPASGSYIAGDACALSPNWAAVTCAAEWSTIPVFGGNSTLVVTLENARWDGSKYGQINGPNGLSIDLVSPDAGAGTNTLTFNALDLVGITADDVGAYVTTAAGSGVGNTCSNDLVLTLDPPEILVVCGGIPAVSIEGSVDIDLQGNLGVIDYTVVYDGTTYDNLPTGIFNLPNINADATSVLIQANGFDAMGNPVSDDLVCDLDYVAPTCVSSQDPPGTVDVGTVVTLFLDTTNAVAATVEGVAMTPDVDPETNFNVQWTSTHVAIADTVLTGTVTNADGEQTTCTWIIDINCIDPSIVDVAPVGQSGITIYGTFECDYTVRIIEHNLGTFTDYTVTIDNLTNPGLNEGTGFLDVIVPPDAWIEVGQLGLAGGASGMVPTVPTLGEWGMIALVLVLVGAGLFVMRRRQLV